MLFTFFTDKRIWTISQYDKEKRRQKLTPGPIMESLISGIAKSAYLPKFEGDAIPFPMHSLWIWSLDLLFVWIRTWSSVSIGFPQISQIHICFFVLVGYIT